MRRESDFAAFFAIAEPKLRNVLTAKFGLDQGREAVGDALSYAWEHWDVISTTANPTGYVYRAAARNARRQHKRTFSLPEPPVAEIPNFEPRLPWAVSQLSERQRMAVLLVHAWGWSVVDVSVTLSVSESSVRTHLARGLKRLRALLEVTIDADA